MHDINYKTISKKDQLRMIRNKYQKLKKEWVNMEDSKEYIIVGYVPCKSKMLIVKEILDDVYNWDADNDCSY